MKNFNNTESVTSKSSYLTKWDYCLLGRTNLHMSGFDLMGCDSWFTTRFWISQINSLLSRVFSWQDKNIKINGIFDGSVTLELLMDLSRLNIIKLSNTLNCELLIVLLFHVLILSVLFPIGPTNLKNSYSRISKKAWSNLH